LLTVDNEEELAVKYVVPAVLLMAASVAGAAAAQDSMNLEDETDRISYSLGYQIGGDFKRQHVQMNGTAVVQGIQDALSDADPQIPPVDMNQILAGLKQKIVTEQKQRRAEQELAMAAAGEKFMEENAKKEGVVTTESGLQYKIIQEGSGRSPGPEDQVTVNYRGTLIDGKEFDSSEKRGKPATFKLNAVIKGWSEGLQLMKEGGKAELYIPTSLGYGDRGPLAHRTLIFDVELLSVGEEPTTAPEAEAAPKAGE
jgi:FKBP-type peptidyl-prolyl cis-trans isomerase FklB